MARFGFRVGMTALPWPFNGIPVQLCIAEIAAGCSGFGGLRGGLGFAEQAALQGQGFLLCHQAAYRWHEDTRVAACRADDASAAGTGSGI